MDPKERWRRLKSGCGFQRPSTAESESDHRDFSSALKRRAVWEHFRRARSTTPEILTSGYGTYTSGIIGDTVETPYGTCFVRTTWIEPSPKWDWETLRHIPASLFRPSDAHVTGTLDQWIFIDVETTGLAGGAGTIPFMIGWAHYEDGGLSIHQGFLRDLDEEPALLHHLLEHLNNAAGIITYNGSAFDRHVLHNRMVLNRMPTDFLEYPHLDLFHWVRRIWQRRWPSVTLQAVENYFLHESREMDLKGSEIPAVYRWYLRHGWHDALYTVFEHNLQDIRSLAALTLRLGLCLRGSENLPEPDDQAILHWHMGRLWLEKDWRQSMDLWTDLLEKPDVPPKYRSRALIATLRLLRRKKRYETLPRILQRLETLSPEHLSPHAWVTAAFYAYRFRRDRSRAIQWLKTALTHDAVPSDKRQRWQQRLDRLHQKIQRPLHQDQK